MKKPTKKQVADWNRKLAAEGFRDIEPVEGGALSGGAAGVRVEPERHEEGAAYTRMVEEFGRRHRFRDDFERDVWRLHCEGQTIRETADELGTYKRRVHETLQRLQGVCSAKNVSTVSDKEFERWIMKLDVKTFYELAPELIMRLTLARKRAISRAATLGR